MASPIMKYFTYIETTSEKRQEIENCRQSFKRLADELESSLEDGPEKSTALRKLLESKDAAVRSLL